MYWMAFLALTCAAVAYIFFSNGNDMLANSDGAGMTVVGLVLFFVAISLGAGALMALASFANQALVFTK